MSDLIELFGLSTTSDLSDWQSVVDKQACPYLNKRCIKVRKSEPEISIGTCSVLYGKGKRPIIICPFRLLERKQIFTDCLHLLSNHEPGNELHIVPEVGIPGGSVDYFLASVRNAKIKDFVGIELQTLDTTGTVWPTRHGFLESVDVAAGPRPIDKPFGMNWKMTAKTILIQLHHKIQTFDAINKHLVLVLQDCLLEYLQDQFNFNHLNNAHKGDPMQFHAYNFNAHDNGNYRLSLGSRLSTDADGLALCLGLQAEPKVELEKIIQQLELKISDTTLFHL